MVFRQGIASGASAFSSSGLHISILSSSWTSVFMGVAILELSVSLTTFTG